jgi:uncharacterized protein YxjI
MAKGSDPIRFANRQGGRNAAATRPPRRRRHEVPNAREVFSIGDDSRIENEQDERAFKVDGKALRVRDTLVLEDTSGAELFSVQEKKLRVRDTMEVERNGQTVGRSRRP